ncbi:MAG: adenosylcobinamide amidohydrolase [Candidatus Rokubacteria bacterium]|nr:adenosylcobinamide amidohydrolase [Candidatus Rokubacteria bacterium]MBI3824484.1 adenosylcobinamide amidohydrolase [Candidatus Rokubacteria bacterium]
MIDGVAIDVDAEAVVVTARHPLHVVSSAVVGGGLAEARALINVHVPKGFHAEDATDVLGGFARRRGVPTPWVGLLTAAATEHAERADVAAAGLRACAIVTVGLSNRSAAGRSAAAAWCPSTINTILIVDAAPEPAALVNLVITATEVKALALAGAGVRTDDGEPASGTSTDAVVVAATGRGPRCRFGGPVSELGACAAAAVREAMERGVRRWLEAHP